jgi:hypothetical protein
MTYTVLLRAQIVAEIKKFTHLLKEGKAINELQEVRVRIRQLMDQLEAAEKDNPSHKKLLEN